jgi:S-DNA-T family DNA segregation ATPase FtsK/SpoIIIE
MNGPDDGNVVYLPTAGKSMEPAEVLDGELLTPEESAAVDKRLAAQRLEQFRQFTGTGAVNLVHRLQDSQRTQLIKVGVGRRAKQTPRATIRASWVVLRGHVSWTKRAIDGLTHGPLRRAVRHAEQMGDHVALAEWSDRLETAKAARMNRLTQLPKTVLSLAKAALVGAVALAVLCGVLALVLALRGDLHAVLDWLGGAFGVVFGVLGFVLPLAALGVPVWWVYSAWREGQRAGPPPQWMVKPDERVMLNAAINEDLITRALAKVKITELTRYI